MAPFDTLVATRSLGSSLVVCRSGKPPEMALSDEKLNLILEVVALVGVVPVVIVESTVFVESPLAMSFQIGGGLLYGALLIVA